MLEDKGQMPSEFEKSLFPLGILYTAKLPIKYLCFGKQCLKIFYLPHVFSQEATEGSTSLKRGNKPMKSKTWDSGKKRSNPGERQRESTGRC